MSDVDEAISIVEYDPAWPQHFQHESARVRAALGPLVLAMEPFGSTAVPGLMGKPIVDLLVGVTDLDDVAARIPALLALGYEDFGEIFIPGRRYLRWRHGTPGFNLAVTRPGSEFWDTAIAIRDYLRCHPDEVAEYARSKQQAVARGATMFSSYSHDKASFVEGLTARALAWSRAQQHQR